MAPKRKLFWTNSKKDLKRKKIESTQCLTSCPIESYNSKVRLFESRSLLRKETCTRAKISRYHILEMENPSQNIYHQIISTDINLKKCDENINFGNIIPTVLPILEKFKEQHNRFKYFDELKNILGNVNKLPKPKYKSQVHVKLLKTFFGFLLCKNVPLELFGTWKNFKAIKKAIYCLLKTHPKKMPIKPSFRSKNKSASMATEGLLDIEPLLRKLDISKITWLDPLKTAKEKWIIVLKLLHWFFAKYIIKILHKYIVVIPIRQQWVYIKKDHWCQMQHAFINEKVKNGDLILDQQMLKEQDIFKCIEKHRLILSSSGLRLLAVRKAEKKSLEISTILTIMQQLYSTFFNNGKGLPTIKDCIQQVNKFKKLNKNHLYYVRCDIQDAFGSIIQEKLLDIIRIYFKELPIYLRMRDCKKKSKKKKHMFEETRQCLDMKQLRNIYIIKSRKPRLLNWLKLISWIKKLLLEQNIILYGKKYSIKTGVSQGLRMSPIFSDIYYQHMSEKLFHKFKSKGVLCRYVDDILYIAEEKNYAEEFLKIVRNGIPEYNVKFNLNKIKTNVELPFYKSTKIKYLGKSLFI